MDTPTQAPIVTSVTTEPDPLLEPFRGEMLRLLEQAFTAPAAARALPKLKKTVEAAWMALCLREPKRRAHGVRRLGGMICSPEDMGDWSDQTEDPTIVPMGAMPNPGGMLDRETFGATAIRELVSAMRPPSQSVTEIVKAIAEARSQGLEDVVDELMQQLRRVSAAPPDPATAIAVTASAAIRNDCDPPPPPLPPAHTTFAGEVG